MTDLVIADAPQLSESDARELTDTIKRTVAIVESQIVRAYFGRAWAALGYESWDEYCVGEFDGARIRLPREDRTMVVGSLRDAGLSIRAIASVTGVATNTVLSDLSQTETPDPDSEIIDAEIIDAGPIEHSPASVTGIDGKTYPATKPSIAPRRSPLTESAERAGWELRRAIERVERVVADDRFTANREQVAVHLNSHLLYAIEVCQGLAPQLHRS